MRQFDLLCFNFFFSFCSLLEVQKDLLFKPVDLGRFSSEPESINRLEAQHH